MTERGAHAILITGAGSTTASGDPLTGPVDSLAKLATLLEWYITKHDGLNPVGGPGQVWVIGSAACQALGWWTTDDAALQSTLASTLRELTATGWSLIGDADNMGPQILISKTLTVTRRNARTGRDESRKERRLVQIVLEPFAPLITKRSEIGMLEDLPGDDEQAAREVGRRVTWLLEHLGVLPMVSAASTGARIQDEVYRARRTKGRGAVVESAGVIPDLDIGSGDAGAGAVGIGEIEPAAHWGRPHIAASEIGSDTELALLDQKAAYLATCGSIELGYGPLHHFVGAEAVGKLLTGAKLPPGVFLAVLPAAGRISVPPNLPLPHPLMRTDRDVTAWITTESVRGLCSSVDEGGAGLTIEDLAIDEAWVWVRHVVGADDVRKLLAGAKLPPGVFLAVLPAAGRISVPPNLPLPHPLMRTDRDVTAWITTESVRGLCSSVDEGGAGLTIKDLAISEAWVWDSTRRFLEDWAATLRAALFAATQAGEVFLERYLKAVYKQYVGRMATDKWSPSKMHHYQPIWRAFIIAHCRWRARRQAMEIYREHHLWPIYTFTDSWRYLVEPDVQLAPTEAEVHASALAGDPLPLGRLVEQERQPLTGEQRAALTASTSGEELSAVIYGGGGVPTIPMQQPTPSQPTEVGDEQPKKHRRQGRREREYVGDTLAEITADVSPRAVADLENLVQQGKFSYLPGSVNHVSPYQPAPAKAGAEEAAAAPAPQPVGGQINIYAVAAIVAVVLLVIAVIILVVVI